MATCSSCVETTKLNLQDRLGIVENVSKEVSNNCEDSSVPLALIRILPCVEAGALSAEDFSLIANKIWKDDLIHLMIEVLRNDYSSLEEHWRILTNLAITLASVLAGLTPKQCHDKTTSTSIDSEFEQVKEYYEIILPTATDSILILANSVLEAADDIIVGQTTSSQDDPASLQECFKKALDSLIWVCASHQQCITRTVQSPYFLHILITDNVFCSHVALGALETLILSDKSTITCIPQNVLTSVLDELVYKMSGKEEVGAVLSLRLLAQFVAVSPKLIAALTSCYSGLLELVKRWIRPEQTIGPAEKHLIALLESRKLLPQEGRGSMDKLRAAMVIQACWRGYSSRKKVVNVNKGVGRFQQLYRKRREERERERNLEERGKVEAAIKQKGLMCSQLAFREKQLSLYENLPASELQEFVKEQNIKAAIKIQSTWRAWAIRSKYKELKSKATLNKSALVIQRALRRNMQQTKADEHIPDSTFLPKLTGAAREKLQQEVACHRALHPPNGHKSEKEVLCLHDRVQKMYEDFYLSRATQRRNDEKAQLLLSQLNRNCDFLLSAPSLEGSVTRPCPPNLVDSLSSRLSSVARMARTAHREELKVLNTPWWKMPPLDHDELVL